MHKKNIKIMEHSVFSIVNKDGLELVQLPPLEEIENVKGRLFVLCDSKQEHNYHAKVEADSHAKVEADSHAKVEADSHAKVEADSHAKKVENVKAQIIVSCDSKQDHNYHGKVEADSHAKVDADSHAKVEADSHAKTDADSHAKVEANSHAKVGADSFAKATCECVMCQPDLPVNPCVIEEKKNNSRVEVKDSTTKSILIQQKKKDPIVIDPSKTELFIVHEAEVEVVADNIKIIEKLVNNGNRIIIHEGPFKYVRKFMTVFPFQPKNSHTPRELPNESSLLKLAKMLVKCNICGMTLSLYKDNHQVNARINHFLQHKISVVAVARKNDNVEFQSDEFDEKIKRSMEMKAASNERYVPKPAPVVVQNSVVKLMNEDLLKTIPQADGKASENTDGNSCFQLPPKEHVFVTGSILESLLKKKTNKISVPRKSKNRNDKQIGKYHVVIGSTVIKKPANQAKRFKSSDEISSTFSSEEDLNRTVDHEKIAKANQSDEAVDDVDDDVEIVEQIPEVIVIDDSDEE